MIPLLDREEARELDRQASDQVGVAGLVLMENAGRGATDVLVARFDAALDAPLVVGGTGQNGGDAWVVARHLRARGYSPRVFLLGDPGSVRGDALPNLRALDGLGVVVTACTGEPLDALHEALGGATLVVDGVFGTGLDRPVVGWRADALAAMDAAACPVVALDVPSGVDADTGRVLGVAPRARVTVTFGAHKRGLHQHPGARLAGDVVLADLGVPPPSEAAVHLFEPGDAADRLSPTAPDGHKGLAGHVVVLGGAPGRTGAAALSALGALRGGAGLVTIGTWASARPAVEGKVVELMTAEIPETDGAFAAVEALAEGKAAGVLGPGAGTDARAAALLRQASLELPLPLVVDADALTAVSEGGALGDLRSAPAPRVLTPHPGEAARLLGTDAGTVQRDRYAAAAELAARSGVTVVLKGAGTIVADPGGARRVCRRGTPALGVAGTGDVLAGVLAAQLARGLGPFDAASVAVLVHALAGEHAATGDRGLLASEVAHAVPRVIAALLASQAAD